jgi:hypothetical protein
MIPKSCILLITSAIIGVAVMLFYFGHINQIVYQQLQTVNATVVNFTDPDVYLVTFISHNVTCYSNYTTDIILNTSVCLSVDDCQIKNANAIQFNVVMYYGLAVCTVLLSVIGIINLMWRRDGYHQLP